MVHLFNCNAHVLLSFEKKSSTNLLKLHTSLEKNSNKIGRDKKTQFYHFSKDPAVGRVCRMTSAIFRPNVDEKSGIRHKCISSSELVTSATTDLLQYSEIIRHLPEISDLLQNLQDLHPKPNPRIQSVLITFLLSLAIIYCNITLPLCDFVTGNTHYIEQYIVIQPLH